MIYIKNDSISIQIPKHSNTISTKFELGLFNKLTLNTRVVFDLQDDGGKDLIYQFNNLDFRDMDPGEYEYILKDDQGHVLESGILQLGEYKKSHTQYEYKKEGYTYNG